MQFLQIRKVSIGLLKHQSTSQCLPVSTSYGHLASRVKRRTLGFSQPDDEWDLNECSWKKLSVLFHFTYYNFYQYRLDSCKQYKFLSHSSRFQDVQEQGTGRLGWCLDPYKLVAASSDNHKCYVFT